MTKTTNLVFKTTKVYESILTAWRDHKKGICLEGGTYSSKTYSALQALIALATIPSKLDINVVSESVPHLKGGSLKDFFNLVGEEPKTSPSFNQTEHIYKPPEWTSSIQFLSTDNQKALGMRRDVLFINEADTLDWETARELISRTNIFVILDWNPRSEFWAHEYYVNDPNWAYDHSTYLDALNVIPVGKRGDIEALGLKDPNYQAIYAEGRLGKVEGLVHPSFQQVDELPLGAVGYGLDFGFASDPTVLTKHIIIGDKLYSQQMFYDYSALTNGQIAQRMTLLGIGREPILADPSEPKSIEEIKQAGFFIQEAVKGPGSVAFGIQRVNQYYQFWTKDSVECIKDQRNYRWLKDKRTGLFTDDTTHQWSHGMDSRRYFVAGYRGNQGEMPAWRF